MLLGSSTCPQRGAPGEDWEAESVAVDVEISNESGQALQHAWHKSSRVLET